MDDQKEVKGKPAFCLPDSEVRAYRASEANNTTYTALSQRCLDISIMQIQSRCAHQSLNHLYTRHKCVRHKLQNIVAQRVLPSIFCHNLQSMPIVIEE